jgi:hypothetical protein
VDLTAGKATGSVTDAGSIDHAAQIDNNFASLIANVNGLIAALERHGLLDCGKGR